MEFLTNDETLLRRNKTEVSVEEALKDKEIILFYFSAHWCPPCRRFTPILADFYEEAKEVDDSIEIIFISSDQTSDALFEYMNESHGEWLAAAHKSPLAENIRKKFGVSGIPMLVVVKKDGTVVTTSGRGDVETKGVQVLAAWKK